MIVFTNKAFFNLCQNFVLASLVLLVLNTKLTLFCEFFFQEEYIYIYIYVCVCVCVFEKLFFQIAYNLKVMQVKVMQVNAKL